MGNRLLQTLLQRRIEGLMNHDRLRLLALAERLAENIARTQRRNHCARVSARRRRRRELAALGIDPKQLPLCDEWAL